MKDKLIAHFEKGIVVLCVGLMGYMIYGALSIKRYDKRPEQFKEMTQKAIKNVEASNPGDEEKQKLTPPDLDGDVARSAKPIDPTPFGFATPWRRPFALGETFRNQPAILKAERPKTQSNRGLLALFATDPKTKERIKRKVKKSEAGYLATGKETALQKARKELADQQKQFEEQARQSGGMGRGMGGASMSSSMMSGMDSGMMNSAMAGGMSMSGSSMSSSSMASMMGGGQNYGDMMNMGMSSGMGSSMGGDMMRSMYDSQMMEKMTGDAPIDLDEAPTDAPAPKLSRDRRFIISKELVATKDEKDAKGKSDVKKDAKKKEDIVEEYIETMVGKHWVEVVAAFPHSEQIKEYVRALREPYTRVGLRYALAEVERRELTPSHDWTPWQKIDLDAQFKIIENAVAFEPEEHADVLMRGLAMNIPLIQTYYKEPLVPEEFTKPENLKAEYTPEEANPNLKLPKRSPRTIGVNRPASNKNLNKQSAAAIAAAKVQAKNVNLSLKSIRDDAKAIKGRKTFNNRSNVQKAMVRFWDFTVVPGKRYQYRIRVTAYNPNFLRNDVADATYADRETLTGPWSDPSDEVYVETDRHWYVASKQTNPKGQVDVEIHYWDLKMGEWLTQTFRQTVGDFVGVKTVKSPNTIVQWDDKLRRWEVKDVTLDNEFDAGGIILEVEGGKEKIGLNQNAVKAVDIPREIVVLNEFGDLVRQDSETDGANSVREAIAAAYKKLVSDMKNRDSNPMPAEPAPETN